MWPFSSGSGLQLESFIIRRLAWARDASSTRFLREQLAETGKAMAGDRVSWLYGQDDDGAWWHVRMFDGEPDSAATDVDGDVNWWPFTRETDIKRFAEDLVKVGVCCEDAAQKYLAEYVERVRRGSTMQTANSPY